MVKERKAIGQKAMVGHPVAQATGIKSWPEDDRPREKLLKKGAGALSNSELLAILLRTGTQGTSAIDLVRKVLKKFGTFRKMAHTDSRDWKDIKGFGGADEERKIGIVSPDYRIAVLRVLSRPADLDGGFFV